VRYVGHVAWGHEVAVEHSIIGDHGTAFSNVDRQVLDDAPIEIVVEWNAEWPKLP
jgi:hypothetical protein